MLSELQPGDRFYFAADRKRIPWQVFVENGEYKANVVAPGFVDGFGLDAPKWFKPQTQVVFLRHTLLSDMPQQPFKLPNE
jgi:hypothetical protein